MGHVRKCLHDLEPPGRQRGIQLRLFLFMHIVHDTTPEDPDSIAAITFEDVRQLALTVDFYMYQGQMPQYIAQNLANRLEADPETGSFSDSMLDCTIIAHLLNLDDECDRASRHVLWNEDAETVSDRTSPELRAYWPDDHVKLLVQKNCRQRALLAETVCIKLEEAREIALCRRLFSRENGITLFGGVVYTGPSYRSWRDQIAEKPVFRGDEQRLTKDVLDDCMAPMAEQEPDDDLSSRVRPDEVVWKILSANLKAWKGRLRKLLWNYPSGLNDRVILV